MKSQTHLHLFIYVQLEIPTVNHPWQAALQIFTPPKQLHVLQEAPNSVLSCFYLTIVSLNTRKMNTENLYHKSINVLHLILLALNNNKKIKTVWYLNFMLNVHYQVEMDPDIFKVTRISGSTQKARVKMLPRRQGFTYKYV